ncbi:MAG TPA: AmmeMemoRadiSam system protein B, partial [Burkholderiales bacterium]|nr:AmmeMemoRadiSam system protein B [Burkholderiales bacterium]
ARLKGSDFSRIVLIGPAHRVWFRGIALPGSTHFETPLGLVPVDSDACQRLASLPGMIESMAAHEMEHGLEVQLPFLQAVLGEFSVVPLLVGDAGMDAVSNVIDLFIGEPGTLVVVSSDLSHFHPYVVAQALDGTTAKCILELDPVLSQEQACGATPINGLLISASRKGLEPKLIDIRNSGDTAGDKRRVVGYASFSFGDTA